MRLLHVTDGYGDHKYYIDGRRCTRQVWHDIYDRANREGRINSLSTVRKNAAWYFYTHA